MDQVGINIYEFAYCQNHTPFNASKWQTLYHQTATNLQKLQGVRKYLIPLETDMHYSKMKKKTIKKQRARDFLGI